MLRFFKIACLTSIAIATGAASFAPPSANESDASPIYGIRIPVGYRSWAMISAASVGAPLSDLRVKLGNEIAMQAYRSGRRPFPDGAIIARLAYHQAASELNNNAFRAAAVHLGQSPEAVEKLISQSFVAGGPTNVQFMVKDSKKYPASGGWGFAEFTNGKADGEAVHKTCFSCHAPAKDRDFVFTDYAP